ncbi:MAG TPA: hypothetical protein VMF06_10470 [Candidatus Limnocylindria bacterium]|jgi:hypothetical protein|nr:hypothetical protein [Candidatus Limnocylindria bacterium]
MNLPSIHLKICRWLPLSAVALFLTATAYGADETPAEKPVPVDKPASAEKSTPTTKTESGSKPVTAAKGESTEPDEKPKTPANDFNSFRIVSQRNIFNQSRTSRRQRDRENRPAPKTSETITLVGTMSYPKGYFAFFDGTSSSYQKTLKLSETIAGYTVKSVTPTGAILVAGTNKIELRVGMQMRKQDDGHWTRVASDEVASYSHASTESGTNGGATPSAPTGEVNDVLKKLMQQREQELK